MRMTKTKTAARVGARFPQKLAADGVSSTRFRDRLA
jgi:hypothetical protein